MGYSLRKRWRGSLGFIFYSFAGFVRRVRMGVCFYWFSKLVGNK